jgi:hypothetical protein
MKEHLNSAQIEGNRWYAYIVVEYIVGVEWVCVETTTSARRRLQNLVFYAGGIEHQSGI